MNKVLINIGCGFNTGDSWVNYDASPTLFFEQIPLIGRFYTKNERRFPKNARFGDIVKRPLCKANTADAVFCSHMLEHVSLHDMRRSLKNIHQMLQIGSRCRLIVPDLEHIVNQYCTNKSENRGHDFIEQTGMGIENPDRSFFAKLKRIFGHSQHYWLYDERSMFSELRCAGFNNIRRCEFGDSEILEFSEVEDESRFRNALAVECYKPRFRG